MHILCQLLSDMVGSTVTKWGCGRGNAIVNELNKYRSNYENN